MSRARAVEVMPGSSIAARTRGWKDAGPIADERLVAASIDAAFSDDLERRCDASRVGNESVERIEK